MQIKLLIADDEDNIRTGVARYIRLHSTRFAQIYEAANGQEAIDLLLRHQPDILLLDVQMPLKSGIDVMRAAKDAGLGPICVVLSGHDEFKYAQQAIKYGAKDYLLKPIRAADILRRLEELADQLVGVEEKNAQASQEQPNLFVREAKAYIAEHYAENISLSDVANAVGISASYLSTMFAQYLHCGFVDYLNQVRIERACCYLDQNRYKNYDIALKVGFRDEKYFAKVFKKVKGVTPKEYRTRENKETV
ncbi:MAG: response regulator [Faecousia sp.]